MSSIIYTVCLLRFVAVIGIQPAAPATVKRVDKSFNKVPIPAIVHHLGHLAKPPAMSHGAKENVSQSMAENKTSAQETKNVPHAKMEMPKPDVPENQTGAHTCADKVLVHGAGQMEPDCSGYFHKTQIQPNKNHSFRPIYRNKHGKFLYFWVPAGNWIIEADGSYDSAYGVMFSHADTMCPEDAMEQDKWKIWDNDRWTDKLSISVKAMSSAQGSHDSSEEEDEDDEEEEDAGEDDNEEEPVVLKREDELEILRSVPIVSEPVVSMKLPIIAALISFTSVLAYSCLFVLKIFKRLGGRTAKGKVSNTANYDFEDLEGGRNNSTKTFVSETCHVPVARKQVHAKDEEKKCAKKQDDDSEEGASLGDNAWDTQAWDDLDAAAV